MSSLISLQERLFSPLARLEGLLPLIARFLFAATLFMWFLNSALTKIEPGVFGFLTPSIGAYVSILPQAFDAAGYDASGLSLFQKAVVLFGTWGEFILPVLVILGLFARASALAMIGFIIVLSLTDLIGHNKWDDVQVWGAWFDGDPTSQITDVRVYWIFAMLVIVFKGGGWLSLDSLLSRKASE